MLDIITVIMCYYFQSGMRSDSNLMQAAWWSSLLRPLESVPCSPPFPRMGACTVKKKGWALVKDNPCSKP